MTTGAPAPHFPLFENIGRVQFDCRALLMRTSFPLCLARRKVAGGGCQWQDGGARQGAGNYNRMLWAGELIKRHVMIMLKKHKKTALWACGIRCLILCPDFLDRFLKIKYRRQKHETKHKAKTECHAPTSVKWMRCTKERKVVFFASKLDSSFFFWSNLYNLHCLGFIRHNINLTSSFPRVSSLGCCDSSRN